MVGDGLQRLRGVSVHIDVLKTRRETFIWSHRRVSVNVHSDCCFSWLYFVIVHVRAATNLPLVCLCECSQLRC